MSDFVKFLALWAVTTGVGVGFGALVRLAVDAWEARQRELEVQRVRARTRAMWDRLGWSEDRGHPSMAVYDAQDR